MRSSYIARYFQTHGDALWREYGVEPLEIAGHLSFVRYSGSTSVIAEHLVYLRRGNLSRCLAVWLSSDSKELGPMVEKEAHALYQDHNDLVYDTHEPSGLCGGDLGLPEDGTRLLGPMSAGWRKRSPQ